MLRASPRPSHLIAAPAHYPTVVEFRGQALFAVGVLPDERCELDPFSWRVAHAGQSRCGQEGPPVVIQADFDGLEEIQHVEEIREGGTAGEVAAGEQFGVLTGARLLDRRRLVRQWKVAVAKLLEQ